MQYKAYIQNLSYEWYEGSLLLNINGISLAAAYTVNSGEFVAKHLKIGAQITVDLWLMYCTHVKYLPLDVPKCFPQDCRICGGDIQGMVISSSEAGSFQVDCGIMTIDVKYESGIVPPVGQMIKTRGTYHVFFPGTECSMENLGFM